MYNSFIWPMEITNFPVEGISAGQLGSCGTILVYEIDEPIKNPIGFIWPKER